MFDLGRIRGCDLLASVEHHASLPSTSDLAKRLALLNETPLPLLVLCDQQTAGRGRGANRWWSGEGGLTFSLVIDPASYRLTGDRLPALSLTTALAVCEAVGRTAGVQLLIKWPNDVVDATRRKIAGILLESPRPDRMVIGVGLNVGAPPQGVDGLDTNRIASVSELAGEPICRTEVLLQLLERLFALIEELASGDAGLCDAWAQRDALRGATVTLETADGPHTGLCDGFSANGALRLTGGSQTTEHLSGSVLAID